MDLENSESAAPLPPTFETTAPLEAIMCPRYSELEEEEESILHRQPEVAAGMLVGRRYIGMRQLVQMGRSPRTVRNDRG